MDISVSVPFSVKAVLAWCDQDTKLGGVPRASARLFEILLDKASRDDLQTSIAGKVPRR